MPGKTGKSVANEGIYCGKTEYGQRIGEMPAAAAAA